MEAFLMLAGIASWFVAVFTFMVATVPVYMSAAFVMFLIGTVFVVGSALLMGVNRVRDLLDERLPKPQSADDDQPLRLRIKDWSAWRRESAAVAPDAKRAAATEPQRRDDRA